MKEFFDKCVSFATAHWELTAILALLVVFILVTVIIIACSSAKKRKAKKLAAAQAAKAAEEKRLAEEQAAKAAEEKRLAEEQAAKEAEEKRLAEEQAAKEAEEKRLAEEQAAKETKKKAAAPKKTAKKSTAKAEVKDEAKVEVKEETAIADKQEVAPAPAPTPAPAPKKTAKKTATAAKKDDVLYDALKDAEEEDEIWYDENETDKAARYSGKWLICRVLTEDHAEEEMYFFELHASNGEKLLSSEEYTSYNGALRGIETHKANIEKGNFKITLSKKGDYIFKLLSGKNMLLCMGEHYSTKTRCESAIESTKRFAKTAVVDENVQDYVVKVPVEDETEIEPLAEGYNGKWIINSTTAPDGEQVYYFELFANNGEKLLSSEEYTTYIGAVNGIHTHKTNIEKGNFRISLTKRGDYIYKLLNGNGQLLCLGEHYKTKRRCLNAVESVKRFAANSPLLTDQKHTK